MKVSARRQLTLNHRINLRGWFGRVNNLCVSPTFMARLPENLLCDAIYAVTGGTLSEMIERPPYPVGRKMK